jgi:hypothetical protein
MKYYVTSVYYKHGEYDITSFDTEQQLREHLIQECLDVMEEREKFNHITEDVLKNMSLKDLIATSKELGEFHIEDQGGYGIVSVIKGEEM